MIDASSTPIIVNVAGDGIYVFLGGVVGAAIGLGAAWIQIKSQTKLLKSQRLFEAKSKAYINFLALITKTHDERHQGIWFPNMSKEEDRKKLHDHMSPVLLLSGKKLGTEVASLVSLFKERPPSLLEQLNVQNVLKDRQIFAVIRNIMSEMRKELELEDIYDLSDENPKGKS